MDRLQLLFVVEHVVAIVVLNPWSHLVAFLLRFVFYYIIVLYYVVLLNDWVR